MINVAILGYGTVGSGVYEVIRKNEQTMPTKIGESLCVKRILDIKSFPEHENPSLFTQNYNEILDDNSISIVCEVMGGLVPAFEFTKQALLKGKHVVTANKELVATHGAELLAIAAENNANYLFEASVGGGIPIIRPLNQCLITSEITQICGILNGTTNYILTKMEKEHISFQQALSQAQQLGYAEANPDSDVKGYDTCRKAAILASLVCGKQVDYRLIQTVGIEDISQSDIQFAQKMSYAIKLVGMVSLETEKILAFVCPAFVPTSHPLANCDDVFNSILVKGDSIGDCLFYGRGAGKFPTASAILADIMDICKNKERKADAFWVKGDPSIMRDINDYTCSFFVRTRYPDKAKELFRDVSMTAIDGEYGFITPPLKEGELRKRISGTDFSFKRVLDND